MMKNNEYRTLEDLLASESFRRWTENVAGDHTSFWGIWVAENPDKAELVEQAQSIIKGVPFDFKTSTDDRALTDQEWQKLALRLNVQDEAVVSPLAGGRTRELWSWILKTVAVITLLLVAGFALQNYVLNPLVTHHTEYGEQLAILLPDNTNVELNANSSLSYRKKNNRKVWLDGEAFFEVAKQPTTNVKFEVVTKDLVVEVLGTAFNVNVRDYKTQVALEEGSVKLNLKRDYESEVFMEPGDMVSFSAKTSSNVQKVRVETSSLASWKNGVLVFEDVPLYQVMNRITEIYGWQAVYQNEDLQSRNISIPLPSDDLESVLILLNKSIGIEIEKVAEDKVLLLY